MPNSVCRNVAFFPLSICHNVFPTDIPFSHAHSDYSSYNARRSCILVVSHPVPVAERRDNKGVLKKQLKDQREKLDDLPYFWQLFR